MNRNLSFQRFRFVFSSVVFNEIICISADGVSALSSTNGTSLVGHDFTSAYVQMKNVFNLP